MNRKRKKFKFIDLFAGIGGFRSGMTYLGGDCVFTNEWDKFAVETYSSWYKDDEVTTEDIRLFNFEEIPDHDILCAGFPCQPFSIAGVSKKQSLGRKHGFDDEGQGNLFFAIRDIAKIKRPRILFLENVKNLRSHDKKRTFQTIKDEIHNLDYQLFHQVISSKTLVPQNRERIFMVAFDQRVFGEDIEFTFPEFKGDALSLGSILESKVEDKYTLSNKLWSYLQDYALKQKKKGNGFGYGLFGPDDVARTMSARYYKDGAEILIKQKRRNPRRITPKEAKYLMGFQDKYARKFGHRNGFPQIVSDTQSYKQFGNAVIPIIVEKIGKEILKKL
tara:strand:+ start:4083 stop:5078 length:996 start_codon:yes stop_codon:yes gene_type:complete